MKLISFNLNNEETFGAVNGDDVINLKPLFEGEANTLKEVLEKDLLAKAEHLAAIATATLKFADLE